jgi:hypothetical protein
MAAIPSLASGQAPPLPPLPSGPPTSNPPPTSTPPPSGVSAPEDLPPPAASQPSCTIKGTKRADNLRGTRGDDLICGGRGRDLVRGRGGNDQLLGEKGSDYLAGGSGDDRIFAVDGRRDAVDGGPGVDLAAVDANDKTRRLESEVSARQGTNRRPDLSQSFFRCAGVIWTTYSPVWSPPFGGFAAGQVYWLPALVAWTSQGWAIVAYGQWYSWPLYGGFGNFGPDFLQQYTIYDYVTAGYQYFATYNYVWWDQNPQVYEQQYSYNSRYTYVGDNEYYCDWLLS